MTSVVIIADNGAAMGRLTSDVNAARGMALVRHASGRVSVSRIVADHSPALIVLGEMSPRQLVLDRLAEIRAASPTSKVVVVAADADARWLGVALSAGAHAVVPGGPSSKALGTVMQEVLDSDAGDAQLPLAQAA
jgi:DNA-binding NarL/FixJ family response regulator